MSVQGDFRLVYRRALQVVLAIVVCQFSGAIADKPPQRGIVVIANRTQQSVEIQQIDKGERADSRALTAGEVLPLAVEGTVSVRVTSGVYHQQILLDPNTAYEFSRKKDGTHELRQIGFAAAAGSDGTAASVVRPQQPNGRFSEMTLVTIPVRILVDEEEPLVQSKWEPRLRERLHAASAILEKHCGVRFEVVAAGMWQSDNGISDFSELLRQLEKERAGPDVRLVIGFTSQRRVGADKGKMGGTRIPLHRHILIREWSKAMSDRERVEVLVHELGHFLGATHSPEMTSVMRAALVDGRSNIRKFQIRFDPVNTLIMNLIAEDMRQRQISTLAELSPSNRQRLDDMYAEIARALPDDPGVALSRKLIAPQSAASVEPTSPIARGVRDVLLSMIQDADEARVGVTADDVTNAAVRRAALTASGLSEDVARPAFLLSLGLVLDDSGTLRRHPQLQEAWQAIGSDPRMRQSLQKTVNRFTVHSRHDLAQHFWVSAALAGLVGERLAHAAGVTKELRDANGGSGFSFADLAADMAGVEFAASLLRSQFTLKRLSKEFRIDDFCIPPQGLPEGLSAAKFHKQFGTVSGDAFRNEESRLRNRILALPGFSTESR